MIESEPERETDRSVYPSEPNIAEALPPPVPVGPMAEVEVETPAPAPVNRVLSMFAGRRVAAADV